MASYVFVESRDPFESRDDGFVAETAASLKKRGHEVTVFFVQNGVLATRSKAAPASLNVMSAAGVRLMADDFSLKERGIGAAEMAGGVKETSIETLVDMLLIPGTRALWH